MKKFGWLFGLLALVSCLDTSDYDIKGFELTPSLAVPLAFGDLSVKDLINDEDTTYIKVYPDDLVYLYYSQELQTQDINNLFDITNQNALRTFSLPGGTIPAQTKDFRSDSISSFIDLGLSPEKLSEIVFKQGTFTYTTSITPTNPNLNWEVQITIPEFKTQSNNAPINLKANGNGTIDLAPYKVGLNSNKFDFKLVLIYKKSNNPVVVAPNTKINVTLNFTNMDFHIIRGFFGDKTANFPNQTVNIGAFGSALDDSNISFVAPKIELEVSNEYGVPCNVNFTTLQAKKGTSSVNVTLNPANPIALNYPAALGESATTTVAITNSKQLLDFNPDQFVYTANARINQNVGGGNNFLADTSKMTVRMNIEVPLYGSATNIILADTLPLDLGDIDASNVTKAELKVSSENELPLDGALQLFLTDDQYNITSTILPTGETGVLKSSTVSASGELTTASAKEMTIALDSDVISKVFDADYIIIQSVMNTTKDSGGAPVNVKFKSSYRVKVNVGLLVDLKIKG